MSRTGIAIIGLTALTFGSYPAPGRAQAQGNTSETSNYQQMGPGMMRGYGQMGPGMMWSGNAGGASAPIGQATESGPAVNSEGAPMAERIIISVLPDALPGPDGKRHDAVMPADYVLRANVSATLVIVNYDEMPHSITAGGLGLNITIPAAKASTGGDHHLTPTVTTYNFTPTHKGLARWYCITPCDNWGMSAGFDGPGRDGYMAGYFDII